MESEIILSIVNHNGKSLGKIISILEEIQDKFGYLPQEALKIVAEKTGTSLVDIYGIATFYKTFSLKPKGKHQILVCLGTACHVRGGQRIAEEFERQLGIHPGETTDDREFTLETVNCLGACALGPIAVVDGNYFPHVTPTKVKQILKRIQIQHVRPTPDKEELIFPVEVSCPRCNHTLMDPGYPIDGYPSIRITFSFDGRHGWLRLSSLYGSPELESEYEIPKNTIVNFFCPHCHAELNGVSKCIECGAPLVPMIVRNGAMVYICSRRGCKGHMLDLNGMSF